MQALEEDLARSRVECEGQQVQGQGEERTLDPRLDQRSQVEDSFSSLPLDSSLNEQKDRGTQKS